ncbi:hypothetical protein [Haloglomus salinum]|jgi:hypothetical protein|uniref:hypothetical protein n=1 Tax=Haloglomus salinum TaxID=2962673 RepID=UPI0020C95EE0|nr:hypothetical protein [Haloglomus salinum]
MVGPGAMDEALEAAEAVEGTELEGILVTLLRVIGAIMVLAGLGLWLFTSMSILWTPALLIIVGIVFITIPGLAFELLGA